MYEDLLLDGHGVKFLGPAPLTLNSCTCSPLSTGMLWAALLGGGFAFLVGGLAGASRFLGTHFPSGMSLVKYNLFPKLCPIPHAPWALFTHTTSVSEFRSLSSSVTRGNMVVLSKCPARSARDTSGSAPQHSQPHHNTMSRNEKFWVDQVTVPHPPLGNDKGWGTTRGGGGTSSKFTPNTCPQHAQHTGYNACYCHTSLWLCHSPPLATPLPGTPAQSLVHTDCH